MTAGFGLEKLGLLTARHPRVTLLFFVLTLPFFLFFASRLEFSSDIREIFRSQSEGFAVLEEVGKQYPASGRDILLVVDGDNIFKPKALSALRFLHLDLGLVPDVDFVLSIFSARYPPDQKGNAESLFPAEITDKTDIEALRKKVEAHPLIASKLLSEDAKRALVVVALKPEARGVEDLRNLIDEIDEISETVLEGTGLKVSITGLAALRVEIIGALVRDQGRFALAGLVLCLGLCWFFFRRWAYVAMAGAPAAIAVIWLAGCMAIVGQEVNVLTNIIPVLVIVLVFSDALHLLFGIRRNIASGQDLAKAIDTAVLEVGPACVLTSVTTTLALLSLTLVPHEFISRFGLTAALGTTIAYCATIALVPAMSAIFLARTPRKRPAGQGEYWFGRATIRFSEAVARMISASPYAVAGAGVVVTVIAGLLYAQNTPRYSYQENLPEGNAAFAAIQEIDTYLGGSNSLHLIIRWPTSHELHSPDTLKVIREAHDALEEERAFTSVSSLHDVEEWMSGSDGSRGNVFNFLEKANSPLSRRLTSKEFNSALLTAQFPAMDSSQLIPILNTLEGRLDKLRAANPGVTFDVTGLTPLSAYSSTEMIGKLNQSLAMAIGVIIVLIGFALRSLRYGIVSIAPNLLPIAAGGTFLYLNHHGLQFTSVVAFTVAFGIAVDSTIHVLNRYRLERERMPDIDKAVHSTLLAVGPVLMVATIILISGVGITAISELPMVQLYGQISSVVLITAFLGAMVFLPALLTVTDKWFVKEASTPAPAKRAPAAKRSPPAKRPARSKSRRRAAAPVKRKKAS
ncbi:MAG: MMPL family transporter [Hyphomicrobiaceae bacterium]|nr:MMPL family transporter [Hyphomicrobiaceae bacterium]